MSEFKEAEDCKTCSCPIWTPTRDELTACPKKDIPASVSRPTTEAA